MMNHFRFLSLSGIAAGLIVLTACASSTTTNSAPDGSGSPAASPSAETSPASPSAETSPASPAAETAAASPSSDTMSQIDLNSASESDLKKLAIKLSIADFPEKVQQNRPYTDVNDLVVKQIITPQQLELIKTDITVVKGEEKSEETGEKKEEN